MKRLGSENPWHTSSDKSFQLIVMQSSGDVCSEKQTASLLVVPLMLDVGARFSTVLAFEVPAAKKVPVSLRFHRLRTDNPLETHPQSNLTAQATSRGQRVFLILTLHSFLRIRTAS